MLVARSAALFAVAAGFEIGGYWLVWQGVVRPARPLSRTEPVQARPGGECAAYPARVGAKHDQLSTACG